ncbi:hypothetical protein L9F63_001167 [Diploptera punctata]|uniref:Uncharacterized protein n=1 Tax=Diploptera punctata TaxID=6984 RepID=A0AAD8EJA3_DIPPU|nr:hypothetical protein L9F63_001167 [Diploptera punctata]
MIRKDLPKEKKRKDLQIIQSSESEPVSLEPEPEISALITKESSVTNISPSSEIDPEIFGTSVVMRYVPVSDSVSKATSDKQTDLTEKKRFTSDDEIERGLKKLGKMVAAQAVKNYRKKKKAEISQLVKYRKKKTAVSLTDYPSRDNKKLATHTDENEGEKQSSEDSCSTQRDSMIRKDLPKEKKRKIYKLSRVVSESEPVSLEPEPEISALITKESSVTNISPSSEIDPEIFGTSVSVVMLPDVKHSELSDKKKNSKRTFKIPKSKSDSGPVVQTDTFQPISSEEILLSNRPLYSEIIKSTPKHDEQLELLTDERKTTYPEKDEQLESDKMSFDPSKIRGEAMSQHAEKKDQSDKFYDVSKFEVPEDKPEALPKEKSVVVIVVQPTQPSSEEITQVKWNKANNIISKCIKNLQNAKETTHMSGMLCLATLEEIVTEESVEQQSENVQRNLNLLHSAVGIKDVIFIQKTVITTMETISTWLQTIEYRVHLSRQNMNTSPSVDKVKEYNDLRAEISHIKESVGELGGVYLTQRVKFVTMKIK